MRTMIFAACALAVSSAMGAADKATPHAADAPVCPRLGNVEVAVDVRVSQADQQGEAFAGNVATAKSSSAAPAKRDCGLNADGSQRVCEGSTHRVPCGIDENGQRIACATQDDAFAGLPMSRSAGGCGLSRPAANVQPAAESTDRPAGPTGEAPLKLAPEAL